MKEEEDMRLQLPSIKLDNDIYNNVTLLLIFFEKIDLISIKYLYKHVMSILLLFFNEYINTNFFLMQSILISYTQNTQEAQWAHQ